VYSDPITEFVESVNVEFDFDGAQLKLEKCKEVLHTVFFWIFLAMCPALDPE
jgi:hypothetical protein